MSKITNGGLSRSGRGCFTAVTHMATVGINGLKQELCCFHNFIVPSSVLWPCVLFEHFVIERGRLLLIVLLVLLSLEVISDRSLSAQRPMTDYFESFVENLMINSLNCSYRRWIKLLMIELCLNTHTRGTTCHGAELVVMAVSWHLSVVKCSEWTSAVEKWLVMTSY